MIKPLDEARLLDIEKASKDHRKTSSALAKAVAAAFPKGTRVRVPMGKGTTEGVVCDKPCVEDPLRVPVRLACRRDFQRSILFNEVELLDDLFEEHS
ncbi:hypothetical protein PsaNZ64_00235 [Pseudomonas syringae pv. actinidiae]|uniref:hypothetical protein n=1 Tax=Pseudomonas syringae group TaxID=136849 RepID=UPI0006B90C2D|nr:MULTISPECIES: hypothetical protein [Pseudomonas syringae group]OKS78743.1 hypothetical protein PsaNZ64_00235 [Pseudomonas syringae pv. actinidiae]